MSKADNAIELLDGLVEQLHYFYNGEETKFKEHVLKSATAIEDTLKELSVNKKETFKRIAKKYDEYYKNKHGAVDINDEQLNDSVKQRYQSDFKADRT